MGAQVDIRFLMGWKGHHKGQVIRPCSMLSTFLLKLGIVELVESEVRETAMADGPPERAVVFSEKPKRKRRPHKRAG